MRFAIDFIAPIPRYFDGVFEAQAAVDVAAANVDVTVWGCVYDYVPHVLIS